MRFIEDSARFFGCQFVIATHSPFLLAVRNARIYDMDEEPVDVKRWTQLPNVRAYYDFLRSTKKNLNEKEAGQQMTCLLFWLPFRARPAAQVSQLWF